MSWDNKLEQLMSGTGIDEEFLACNFTSFPANIQEVEKLASATNWLSESYLDFLKRTNGVQLGTFVLFGVAGDTITTLDEEIRLWKSSYQTTQWIPIGKDASGHPILMRSDRTIHLGSIDSPGVSRSLSDSFEVLLDSVLMGNEYSEYMGGNVTDDEWYGFLVKRGWAT